MGLHEINTTLTELAELTGGRVSGDGDVLIKGVCSLDNPRADYIAFALNPSGVKWAEDDECPAALIVSEATDKHSIPQLVHKDPRLAFTHALRYFHSEEKPGLGIDPRALVAPDAEIDPSAYVGPFAVIESKARIGARANIGAGCFVGTGSSIGEDTLLHPNVSVLHDVTIGARCIFNSGVVIGGDGFGFTPTPEGNLKVPQVGGVEIGDDVEIGANSTVDRATIDMTRIGDDVKIDNQVQVAHNVQIGSHTRIAAQVGISGSVTIGKNVVVAGQAGFQNGIVVGDGCIIGGRAAVTRSIPAGSQVSGYPARDHKKALRLLAAQNRLPELIERLEKIERILNGTDKS